MKKIISVLSIVIIFSLVGILTFSYLYVPKHVINFQTTDEVLEGPSRGFYIQVDSGDVERLEALKAEGVNIILVAYDIEDYLNQAISEEKIAELRLVLEEARKLDLEVVFRAAYGFDSEYDDPDNLEQIIEHIHQVSGVINVNKDIILSVQAGFLGPWGEWHNSDFLTGDDEEIITRNLLIEAMLDRYDDSIKINLRKPKFVMDAKEAGLNIKRLGFHNDGLLASETDLGTYGNKRAETVNWVKTNISQGVNGGEMPMISQWTNIENAEEEFRKIAITYLNKMYNQEVLEDWQSTDYKGQNGLTYMENHLGYRFLISGVEVSSVLKSNRTFNMNLVIENVGFAPIGDDYALFLIATQNDEVIIHEVLSYEISELLGGQKGYYSCDLVLDNMKLAQNNESVHFGVYMTDDEYRYNYKESTVEELPSQYGKVEFANDPNKYEKGVNFFFTYEYVNGMYRLIE